MHRVLLCIYFKWISLLCSPRSLNAQCNISTIRRGRTKESRKLVLHSSSSITRYSNQRRSRMGPLSFTAGVSVKNAVGLWYGYVIFVPHCSLALLKYIFVDLLWTQWWVMRCWRGYLSGAKCKWVNISSSWLMPLPTNPSSLASLKSRLV